MKWTWFHRFGSPRWFYYNTGQWLTYLASATGFILLLGIVWGLAFVPMDAKQGNSFRIIYLHVPASILAMAGYYVMAIAGAIGLIWRVKLSFMVMKSAAPIGATLTFLGLLTGAVWGKPTWGAWWVWDARVTSMLLLLFLYLGVIALQEAYQNREVSNKASAILALIGTINVPIIYKSVDWWFTLHQPSTIKFTESSSIDPSMGYPLFLMLLGYYMLYVYFLILWTRTEVLKQESRTRWVKDLVMRNGLDPTQ